MWLHFLTLYLLGKSLQGNESEDEQSTKSVISSLNCVSVVPCPFEFDDSAKVNFRLYTRKNPEEETRLLSHYIDGLKASNFDSTKPTKVLIHGYLRGHDSSINQKLKSIYLSNHDVNVIVASWGRGSKTPCYNWAVKRTKQVGNLIGEFLDFLLKDDELAWNNLTVVGHSLGAHIAGFAGKAVTNGIIGTIVGLDPGRRIFINLEIQFSFNLSLTAGPYFSLANTTHRLNINDASYVECIHTNWKCFGFKKPICTADFYPNGGYTQPGCSFMKGNKCDHSRAVKLFGESLKGNKFQSQRCKEPVDFGEDGKALEICNGSFAMMGGEPGNRKDSAVYGVYYLKTSDTEPFSLNEHGEVERGNSSVITLNLSISFLSFLVFMNKAL